MRRRRAQEEASSRGRERDRASGAASGLGPGRARGEGTRGALRSWQMLRDASRFISHLLPCTLPWQICCPLSYSSSFFSDILNFAVYPPCSLMPSIQPFHSWLLVYFPLQLVLVFWKPEIPYFTFALNRVGGRGAGQRSTVMRPVLDAYSVFTVNVRRCHAT